MKKIILFSLLLSPISRLIAQATFSSPESVQHDAAYNRWIVGNNGTGTVVFYYPTAGTTTQFASGLATGPHGIEILGSNVYVCDGGYMRGYSLATGANNFNLNCNATFLNGLTTDGSTYLFATDFSAKKIYRINPAANAYNIMCSTTKTPNGIIYDGANNRLVFVTWGSNAPIQAVSLADSTVSTLTNTTLSNCDGVTRDNAGYWYVTNWGANSMVRFTPAFTTPTSVMTGLTSPADIDINAAGDSIGIPNNGTNSNVVFYTGITTAVNETVNASSISVSPNPAVDHLRISFGQNSFNGYVDIYSMDGQLVKTEAMNGYSVMIDLNGLSNGNYFAAFRSESDEIVARKEFSVLR